MKFVNIFKNKRVNINKVQENANIKIENLPQLIRQINNNKTDLLVTEDGSNISQNNNLKDPLYIRIEKFVNIKPQVPRNYLSFLYPYLPYYKRYKKEIYRPNIELREMHFGMIPTKFKKSVISYYIVIVLFFYILGYGWAKLKYDTYVRKFMFVFMFSYMMAFEFIDYQIEQLLENVQALFPKEMTEEDVEYILYTKFHKFFEKRKMLKKIEAILNTDPEIFEIDEILKKINK